MKDTITIKKLMTKTLNELRDELISFVGEEVYSIYYGPLLSSIEKALDVKKGTEELNSLVASSVDLLFRALELESGTQEKGECDDIPEEVRVVCVDAETGKEIDPAESDGNFVYMEDFTGEYPCFSISKNLGLIDDEDDLGAIEKINESDVTGGLLITDKGKDILYAFVRGTPDDCSNFIENLTLLGNGTINEKQLASIYTCVTGVDYYEAKKEAAKCPGKCKCKDKDKDKKKKGKK